MNLLRETAIPGDDEHDEETDPDETGSETISTVIARVAKLSELVTGLPCPSCRSPTLAVRAVNCALGLVCRLQTCTSCDGVVNTTYSSDRIGGTAGHLPFVVTRAVVSASLDMGVGHSGIVKLCRYLDMNTVSQNTFDAHSQAIVEASMVVADNILTDAAKVVRQVYPSVAATDSDADDDIIDLAVSYDGSWMKRGHTSAYGIGCVIDTLTGLVLDLTILSSYCQACSCAEARCGGRDTAQYQTWLANHKNCNANYHGTSGGMEVKAAEILWGRSLNRGFRYTTMVSDGDARTFKHLTEKKVYGDDVTIEKEECINHVAKRMGTALRKLATQTKKAGVTLGGRGQGKLTANAITQLTGYYGKAIRSHPNDLDGTQDAVFATFNHVSSTDEKPNHGKCPTGTSSWCFYQRALAEGKQPGDHASNVSTPLSPEVAAHVEDVYLRLGHRDLLSRCLRNTTQNRNESLHARVWAKCPKTGFVGMQRVLFATCLAVSEFNSGALTTVEQLYSEMGMPTGTHLIASGEKADSKRLKKSLRQAESRTKEVRRARKLYQVVAASASASDYAPGEF